MAVRCSAKPRSMFREHTGKFAKPAWKANCAEREPIPLHQFRDGECRAGTRNLIVRACAAVVLAGFLVSGVKRT